MAACPLCASGDVSFFFEMKDVPTGINFPCASAREALDGPRGDIRLAFCPRCGLISNIDFDSTRLRYGVGYENTLHFSEVFRRYAEATADRLIAQFELRGKDIIEIGCGRGDFLRLLCERGGNRGVGFDPSHAGSSEGPPPLDRIRFVPDAYSERYVDYAADFVVSRHTLEHVQQPADLLGPLRRSIGDRLDTAVFFEVPNTTFILRNRYVWDIIYEHPCYFTGPSLRAAFERSGFRVLETYDAFEGQYLCVEAYPSEGDERTETGVEGLDQVRSDIESFEMAYQRYVAEWKDNLRSLATARNRVVLWGAGSKGITFLNLFRGAAPIRHVVDINPLKHGSFVAGSGQEIVPPEFLVDHPVDTVIVANPIYGREVTAATHRLGLSPEFLYL